MARTIILEFEEYPDDEFTVTVSPVPLATFEKISELYGTAAAEFTSKGTGDGIRALAKAFGPVAHPQAKGKGVALADLDPNLALALVRQWHAGVRKVPLPLPRRSSAGEPSAETSPQS